MVLKTLKDLDTCDCDCGIDDNPVHHNVLRSAAREWIKELETENKLFFANGKIGRYEDGDDFSLIYYEQEARDKFLCNISKIGWIKHFFNLDVEEKP